MLAFAPARNMCSRRSGSNRCEQCDRSFTTSRALLRHYRETICHQNGASGVVKKHRCTKCGEAFSRNFDRRRHERRRHSNQNSNSFGQSHVQQISRNEAVGVHLSPLGLTDAVKTPAQLSPSSFAIANVNQAGLNKRKRTYEDTTVESDHESDHESDAIDIEKLSIHDVGHSTFRRNPRDNKAILCNICRQPFNTDNLQSLHSHLNDHFRGFNTVNRCNECGIDFIEKADLDKHRISAATGHCGFKFHHTEPCTGHHPPGEDHIKLWDRIRHWQQCQLQSFIDRVDELSKRVGKRYTQTENTTPCRGCRILDFYHQCYPEEYRIFQQKHPEGTRWQGPNEPQCCHIDMTDAATDQLLSKLTSRRRRRRASSAEAEYIRNDADVSQHKERWSVQFPASSIESEVSGILDTAYLSDPLQ